MSERQQAQPLNVIERLAERTTQPHDLASILRRPGVQLIAEIKRRSPSRGDIQPDLAPGPLAVRYAEGGATALSVLTEPDFFGGSLCDLAEARSGLMAGGFTLPILRKDFIIDPYQVVEARAYLADAILLIVAALLPADLALLYAEARRWGLSVLVEVHNAAELEQAIAIEAEIIGINSRDLHDMSVNLAVVERLRPRIPSGVRVVAESGIRSAEDVRRLRDMDVDAILVGETLVRAADPVATARRLVEAGA